MPIQIRDAKLQQLVNQMTTGGRKIDAADVQTLIDAAYNDNGKLSSAEQSSLRSLLSEYADQLESPEVGEKLKQFTRMTHAGIRDAAHRFAAEGGISETEARSIQEMVNKDGKVSSREKVTLKALMGYYSPNMEPGAKKLIADMAGVSVPPGPTPEPGGPGLQPVPLQLPTVAGKTFHLSPEGHLTSGQGPARFDEAGALELYRGAQALAKSDASALRDIPTAHKTQMLEHLKKAFVAGKDDSVLPKESSQQMRSGAATTLMSLIEGCKDNEADLKQQAIGLYFDQAKQEPLHGIRASMFFNMEKIQDQLNPAQKAQLADLEKSVIPASPPYDKWFADGKREINVVQYAHHECWKYGSDPISQYQAKGYKVVESHPERQPPTWTLERVNANAPGGPITMKVEVVQSHDGIFSKMDNPNTDVVVYTGHSNLGGNVSEELRLGNEAKGEKLVMLAMCRGKQNMFEVANKYPDAHFVTTNNPSYFSSVMPMSLGMLEGLINKKDYATMKNDTPYIMDDGGKDNYFYPHEARRYSHYDVDKDGVIDGRGAHVDRLYDISLRPPSNLHLDGVVRPNQLHPEDIEGSKVLHATQFLNTLMTYHVDHGHNSSTFKSKDMDNFAAGGWFDGPAHEKVRLTELPDGKIKVQVNKGLSDQSGFVLGAVVQYEVTKQLLSQRNGGTLTPQDEARAALFAGEYLAYMYCSWNEANQAIRAIGQGSQHLPQVSFDRLMKAIDTDGHGYVTDAQVNALLHP